MLIRNVQGYQIEQAIRETPGVEAEYVRGQGRGYRVKLGSDGTAFGRRGFKIRKDGERVRMPHVLCWHGFRDFMRALYRLEPNARIATGLATYLDSEHFERTFEDTGYRNIGSQVEPLQMRDACDCERG